MLRNIQALTKSAGASILAYPCNLFNLDGVLVTGTGPLFLQLFDKASAPVANDVPVECYEVTTTGPFPLASVWQAKWPIPFTLGLAVGISSVDFKYTAATASYSVSGQIEEGMQSTDAIPSLSTTGDTTTHVNSLAVWNDGDASNANSLIRLDIANTLSNTPSNVRYVMVFGVSSHSTYPQDGDLPVFVRKLAGGASTACYFGPEGLRPRQVGQHPGIATDYNTTFYGCAVVLSTSPTTLLTDPSNNMTCKAYYKALTQ